MKRVMSVLWFLAGAAAAKSLLTRLFEPDLWWHLALARQMVLEGAVTRTDIFSHTFGGTPYINFEWLAQLGFYGAWAVGGLAGIFTLKILAGVGLATALALGLRRWGARGLPHLALWWALFWTLRPRLNERPELATLAGLAALMFLLHHALVSPGARKKILGVGFFLMVVWSNAHGGWVFAPALTFLLAAGAWWAPVHRRDAPFLLLLSAVLAAGGLVSPYGPGALFVHVLHFNYLARENVVAGVVHEWMPTAFRDAPVFWALIVAAAAALCEGLVRARTSARLWLLPVVVFGAWGVMYYRNAGLFVFIAGPFLAMWLSEVSARGWKVSVLVLPALLAFTGALPAAMRPLPRTLYQGQRVPEAACRFLVEENIRGRMFNVLEQGGYIEWTVGPDRKVFMDGRYTFFPLMREVPEAARSGTLARMMDKYAIDHAIVSHAFLAALRAPGAAVFPPDTWALVQWDDAGYLYLRRVPVFEDVIRRREYHLARSDGGSSLDVMTGSVFESELARHRAESPFSLVRDELERARAAR